MTKLEYTTKELLQKYKVTGFGFGYCVVKDKLTNELGTFDFKNRPRIYFDYHKH